MKTYMIEFTHEDLETTQHDSSTLIQIACWWEEDSGADARIE